MDIGQRVGGYELVSRLGTGGAGTVWLARDDGGAQVALKMLHPAQAATEEARQRLSREAATVNRIRSDGVVRVLDVETEAAEPFVVTEYVNGPTLASRIRSGTMELSEVARLATALNRILKRVHGAGVVHRDIKPSNIILSERGPVLIDFGIAVGDGDDRLTATGLVSGTAGYTAPEVMTGSPVTPQADWWSLSATILHALTGRPPFGGGAPGVIISRVLAGDADIAGLPPRLASSMKRCLDPTVDNRMSFESLCSVLNGAADSHARDGYGSGHDDETDQYSDTWTGSSLVTSSLGDLGSTFMPSSFDEDDYTSDTPETTQYPDMTTNQAYTQPLTQSTDVYRAPQPGQPELSAGQPNQWEPPVTIPYPVSPPDQTAVIPTGVPPLPPDEAQPGWQSAGPFLVNKGGESFKKLPTWDDAQSPSAITVDKPAPLELAEPGEGDVEETDGEPEWRPPPLKRTGVLSTCLMAALSLLPVAYGMSGLVAVLATLLVFSVIGQFRERKVNRQRDRNGPGPGDTAMTLLKVPIMVVVGVLSIAVASVIACIWAAIVWAIAIVTVLRDYLEMSLETLQWPGDLVLWGGVLSDPSGVATQMIPLTALMAVSLVLLMSFRILELTESVRDGMAIVFRTVSPPWWGRALLSAAFLAIPVAFWLTTVS